MDEQENNQTTAGTAAAQPLFYPSPHPVHKDRHKTRSIKPKVSYSFAAQTNSVPAVAAEFSELSKTYPIVFTDSTPSIPVALLGFRSNENSFVDRSGSWLSGAYVPAYVRRYPFIFWQPNNSTQQVLCLEETADCWSNDDGESLFEAGEPGPALTNALQFCELYQRQYNETERLSEALETADMLQQRTANYESPNGQKFSLSGFRLVDEERFNSLPDETFLMWRRNGWLAAIYCHFMSVGNLRALGERTLRRQSGHG